jgi:hypothetical protein
LSTDTRFAGYCVKCASWRPDYAVADDFNQFMGGVGGCSEEPAQHIDGRNVYPSTPGSYSCTRYRSLAGPRAAAAPARAGAAAGGVLGWLRARLTRQP